ncbi:MAG: D-alanyl-D-alanine carboxypeptidase [Actinobacteria bacterium]|nr:D-alanyl-D-alanine carboxypeptidase [Actinomycetota bacterium]
MAQNVAAHSYPVHEAGRVGKFFKRLSVVVLVVVILAAAGTLVQLFRSLPTATVSVVLPSSTKVPGPPLSLPWPKSATASLEVDGIGTMGGVRANEVRPLASVTKLFTALVVLKHHPLAVGQNGPTITLTPADAAAYSVDAAQKQSVVPVAAGEHLTELQALEAMLVPSANNVADILATWSAGSKQAFVAQMNQEATALGLHHTHLADPAGINPGSVGTAADMVRLAGVVMANPLLRQIVAMPQVTLPVAGTVYNYNYALGHDGIVGVKTGSTTVAGGNFVFAASRVVAGRSVTIFGAVLGAPGVQPLLDALHDGENLASAAFSQLRLATVLPAGQKVVVVKAKWGNEVTAGTSRPVSVFGFTGEPVQLKVTPSPVLSAKVTKLAAGQKLATVVVNAAGGQAVSVPVVAPRSLPQASLRYRLTRF